MKKEEAIELWQEKLAGQLSPEKEAALSAYLSEHEELSKELDMLSQTWELFDELERPEPSEQMDARFEGMMAAYAGLQRQSSSPGLLEAIQSWFSRGWQVGLASLMVGVLVGWLFLPAQTQSEDINKLSGEIQDMKKLMMLSLIEQPKAQERIRAVNMASEIETPDDKVIRALIATLNQDDNLNVRLAALESLILYGEEPKVRHALVDALKIHDSAIMLVAIADALVAIHAKQSIETMEEVKKKVEDDLVRDKLEESIRTLASI